MNRYVYSIIRFSPLPITGEFVNVGLIIGSDETGEWLVQRPERDRCKLLTKDPALQGALSSFMAELDNLVDETQRAYELGFDAENLITEEYLHELERTSHNVIQMSPVLPVLSISIDEACENLMAGLVPEGATRRSRRP